MLLRNTKVEQITASGEIINDYGEILTKSEISNILTSHFPNLERKSNLFYGIYENVKYCIVCKNISYLGVPHPIHKKRIQISSSFKNIYNENKKNGIITILLGIYKYKTNILFCDFNTEKYINNKVNNSSAHVYSIDLLNGLKNGYFRKTDMRGNIITCFDVNNIENFFKTKFFDIPVPEFSIFSTLDDFFINITKEWFGIDAYTEMIDSNYHNKFQSEWPGTYLEYKLEEYLKVNNKENIISFHQDKKKSGIDLDLMFPSLGLYGDLKAHSVTSSGIQGNDYDTIMSLIDKQSVYYVVANHYTEKDKEHNYVVTKFWNEAQGKDDLMSYANKMKYSVKISSYSILELNKYNKKYICIYKQGKNSNGKPREPKINIKNKDLPNFIIHSIYFDDDI